MPEAEYEILGKVAVRCGPDAAHARLSQQSRLLLARLLLVPGAPVTTDAVAGALWGDEDRASRRDGVHHAVGAARRLLHDTARPSRVIVFDGDAYRIVVNDPLRIDAERFRQLAACGHELVARRPRAARAMLAEALAAWRGPVFGELAGQPWAIGHAAELAGIRDQAEIDLNEARLALGEHATVEAALRHQINVRPSDERLRGQLIRALLAAGRASDALIDFRQAVRDLAGAGPELMRLGEHAARGTLGEAPPFGTAEPPPPALGGEHSAGVVLWAELDLTGRAPEAAGLGTLALIVAIHGGAPRPIDAKRLVATFDDGDAALAAARAVSSDDRLAVRIAVHKGAVIDLGDELIGPAPARCRELLEAAHRGQVLVSAQVGELAGPSAELRDLGEHQFPDLEPAARLFELANPKGIEFPPPETLARRPHNLPVQRTRFVGRAADLATLSQHVARGAVITLTGPGGCGKTRLALQLVAQNVGDFVDGAWFVALAELETGVDIEQVAGAIANQLGVRALPEETLPAAVVRHFSDRVALLVVDNCEQVRDACAELIAQIHLRCPGACVVATSRRRLGIDGESTCAVEPLATDARRPGLPSDAVQLLLERAGTLPADAATSATGTLANAESICRAFDGLPLAIELAAGQVSTRTLAGVAAEVESMLSGARPFGRYSSPDPLRPERHRTIDSAIDWSYRLLSDGEQSVLRQLAVFRGTLGESEARELIGADRDINVAGILTSLLECSMVVAAPPLGGAPRMRLLEPIRAFALRLLDAEGALAPTRARHAGVFHELAVRTATRLFGPDEYVSLERLEAEHDNLRAALAWYVDGGHAIEALQLAGALWWMWFSHGHLEEGSYWVRRALELDDAPSRERVRALRAASHLAWWRGDFEACHAYNVELAASAETIGDDWGQAWAQMAFGAVEMFLDPPRALQRFADSKRRFEALGCPWEASYALQVIGGARWFGGDYAAAGAAYEEAAETFDRLGHSSVLASAQRGAGLMAAHCGNPARGSAMCLEALRLSTAIGDRAGSAQALNFVAAISRDSGDHETAARRYSDALALAREVGELWATCWSLDGLAGVARAFGEPRVAARLLAHSGRLASRAGYRQAPHELRLRRQDLAALRDTLGAEDFERASAEGELMGVGAAVSFALTFASRHT